VHWKITALGGGKKWNCTRPSERSPQVFLCAALLGRASHRLVVHLSVAWGDLKPRIPLLENVLDYGVPTSPKLHPEPAI
jgi:hypothetical protein